MKKPNIEEIENWFKRDGHTSESWMADRLIEYINYLECMKGDHMSATTAIPQPAGSGGSIGSPHGDCDNWKHRSKRMKCATCMFFVLKASSRARTLGDPEPGRCRRRAPTLNGWPFVWESDWCGDHKMDEEKA